MNHDQAIIERYIGQPAHLPAELRARIRALVMEEYEAQAKQAVPAAVR